MAHFSLHLAKPSNAEELLKIYEPYILHTPVTFEYTVPKIEDFRKRIEKIQETYPYLVCEKEQEIVGYAYAHKHQERAAFQWNAELSVYVKEGFQGVGIGQAFYRALTNILKLQNVINIYSLICVPNAASEKLHEKMGFRKIGVYGATGYKCGKWQDLAIFEKRICNHMPETPKAVIPIDYLEKEEIESILDESIKWLSAYQKGGFISWN